jgi:hypothetical protein
LTGPGKVWVDDLTLSVDQPPPVAPVARATVAATLPPPGRTADQILDDFLRAIGDVEPYRPRTLYLKYRMTFLPHGPNEAPFHAIAESWFGPQQTRSLGSRVGFGWEVVLGRQAGWFVDPSGFHHMTPERVRANAGAPTAITEHRRKDRFRVRAVVPPPAGAPAGRRLELVALSGGPGDTRELHCFDAVTHLRVYEEGIDSDGNAYSDLPSNYRTIAGIEIPAHSVYHEGNQVQLFDLLEAEENVKLSEPFLRTPARPDSTGQAN